jgi:Ca2+-binding RTX toxin-like protein
VLDGGAGNDSLNGDEGNDILTGGSGDDYFIFEVALSGHDVITDFNVAEGDTLGLHGVLDLVDSNVSVSSTDEGDVLIKFKESGATIELDGFQNQNYGNLTELAAAIDIATFP